MGNIQAGINFKRHPELYPEPTAVSKWDPHYGFSEPREAKSVKVSEEDLYSAKIPLKDRDYCAHRLMDYRQCYHEKFPWLTQCNHEKHLYIECQYNEFMDRMKDYEREKRLMHREKRKEAASA